MDETSAQASTSTGTSEQVSNSSTSASSGAQSSAAPATTLWENFMASFRNVTQSGGSAQRNESSTAHNAPAPSSPVEDSTRQSTSSPGRTSSPSSAQHASAADPDSQASGLPHPPVYFRLPFAGPDGNPALLAFHPQPLPSRDETASRSSESPTQSRPRPSANANAPNRSNQPDSAQPTIHPTGFPGSGNGANPAASHSHPHPDGHVPVAPLFVPFGASPLPFSFIYDSNTQTAWPIAQVTPGSPPGGPSPDAPESQQPRLVAGPPFRILLDIHFTPAPEAEQPDPKKAADFVKQLERADAELRARMARLGMGSIGGFGDAIAGGAEADALLGCGICLDSYDTDDRPEWIDGPKSQDEAVVAVPCSGHHTLHAGCLRDWLEKLPPSQWTCPFCRASIGLSPKKSNARDTTSSSPTKSAAVSSASAPHTTLREEVRARERKRGWRCDAPACLPRYPLASQPDDGHLELPETTDDMTTELVKLAPCHHEVHLDCLCTSMRIENDLVGAHDLDAILGSSDSEPDSLPVQRDASSSKVDEQQQQRDTVGKWVNCPACRKETWAQLPLRRRPNRPASEAPPAASLDTLGDGDEPARAVQASGPSRLEAIPSRYRSRRIRESR
ncbi:RING-type domain-containing protein [Pseudozyma hubeiensis]|nr:RING-type domain-containing protein [Pseudozyma hubeiensis]